MVLSIADLTKTTKILTFKRLNILECQVLYLQII